MKPSPIEVQVAAITDISPHMRRITLSGQDLSEFQDDCVGGYIKFLFDDGTQSKPAMRTYTIRAFKRESCCIDVDFVVHGTEGIASSWASSAKTEHRIKIAGLGPRKLPNQEADWFFLIGDMSALPALSINLESLAESAEGYALILVDDMADKQNLIAPEGIQIEWIHADHSTRSEPEKLFDAVQKKPWMGGTPAVWLAGEFSLVKRLRQYFKSEMKVSKAYSYYSSYWKYGLTEPDHKILKQKSC